MNLFLNATFVRHSSNIGTWLFITDNRGREVKANVTVSPKEPVSISNPILKSSTGGSWVISTHARTHAWRCRCHSTAGRTGPQRPSRAKMDRWRKSHGLLSPEPQWSFTGGINSLVVNTLCVANTAGDVGIMGRIKKEKIKCFSGCLKIEGQTVKGRSVRLQCQLWMKMDDVFFRGPEVQSLQSLYCI